MNNNEFTMNVYQRLAMRTANKQLSAEELLLNGVLGLGGEAGECQDLVKKNRFQNHELNREKLINELGDVLWYIALTAHSIGVSLDAVAAYNIGKLEKRYPDGFDSEKSIHREE